MKTFDKATRCPHCGATLPLATDLLGERAPHDGDAMLCIRCGHWCIFASTSVDGLRKTTPAEAAELAIDTNCAKLVLAWRQRFKALP